MSMMSRQVLAVSGLLLAITLSNTVQDAAAQHAGAPTTAAPAPSSAAQQQVDFGALLGQLETRFSQIQADSSGAGGGTRFNRRQLKDRLDYLEDYAKYLKYHLKLTGQEYTDRPTYHRLKQLKYRIDDLEDLLD